MFPLLPLFWLMLKEKRHSINMSMSLLPAACRLALLFGLSCRRGFGRLASSVARGPLKRR